MNTKKLKDIVIQGFYSMDGTYFTFEEMIYLIIKARLEIQEYLLNLVRDNDWNVSQVIIDVFSKNNSKNVNELKKDENFINKLKLINKKHLKHLKETSKSLKISLYLTKVNLWLYTIF